MIKLLAARRVRYLLLTLLALLYAGCIGYLWQRGVADLFDFNTYYMASYAMRHDIDIYAIATGATTTSWQELAASAGVEHHSTPFRYLPLIAQIIVPLLRFPPMVAGMIWLTLTALAFLVATWWLGKLWTQPEGASIVYLLMLGFVPPIIALREGQVAGLLLVALVAGLAGLARRNLVMAGVALALAVHLKLIPIVLCLYLGWRKQWLAAAVAALVIVGLLLTVPPMFGVDVLSSYFNNFDSIAVSGQLFPRTANQGISGLWARLLLPYMDAAFVYQTYLLSAVAIVVATIAACWPLRELPHYWRYEYALILCALLLIPPFTWYHMLTLLLIPLAIVVEQLWRARRWGWLALIALLYVATDVHGVIYRHVAIPPWLSVFPLLLVLLLWGLLAWMIVGEKKTAAEEVLGRKEAVQRIDALREHVFVAYGEQPDSTELMRADRER